MHLQPLPGKSKEKQPADGAFQDKPYKPLYPVFNVPIIAQETKDTQSGLDKEENKWDRLSDGARDSRHCSLILLGSNGFS